MATVVANGRPFWGMVIFEMMGDGTLSGTWKNNRLSNDSILGEIAKKTDSTTTIEGAYVVSWIDENNLAHVGSLEIRLIESNTAFSFIWTENGNEVFRGMGMPIGLNQIAATYWDINAPLTLTF